MFKVLITVFFPLIALIDWTISNYPLSEFIDRNINYLISSSSTLLLEASLFRIFPLMLITKDDYSNNFLSKKIVFPIYSFKNFPKRILNLGSKVKQLNKIRRIVWC